MPLGLHDAALLLPRKAPCYRVADCASVTVLLSQRPVHQRPHHFHGFPPTSRPPPGAT